MGSPLQPSAGRGLSLVVARVAVVGSPLQPAAVRGLSLVVARVAVVGFPLQPAAGRGLWGPLAPVVAVCRLSSPMACGIFPDQGLNPCPLHWQADS